MAQKKAAAAKAPRKKTKQPAPKAAPLLAVADIPTKVPSRAPGRPATRLPAKAPANVPANVPVKAIASAPGKAATKAATVARGNDFGDLELVGQENFKACVKCGTIVAEGVGTLGNEVMSFTQASIEADLAAAKGILAAGTLREAIDLQADFAQARLARLTSETAKLGELSMRFASLAMEPLRSRFGDNPWANPWANTWTVFRPLGR